MDQEATVLVVGHRSAGAYPVQKALFGSWLSGFRFEPASCSSEALARLQEGGVDAVLLDLELSGSQGLEMLRAMIRLVPEVPIVVLTGMQDEAIGQAALREGARDYLVKGAYTDQVLVTVLRSAVDYLRVEEIRRRSERFAQAALDGLSDNIAIVDEAGVIMMVNRAWREFAEANQGDVARVCEGANYLAVCDGATGSHSEGASEMAAAIRAVLTGEDLPFTMEYPCHSPNQERWFTARLNLFAGGGPPRAVIAHENITERRIAEKKLRASEMLYRAVVEDQTELICRFRADGTFIFANEVYCRFFGRRADELIGKKWQPMAVSKDLPRIEAQLASLSPSNPVVVIVNRVHAGTGEVHWMQFVNRAFHDAAGCLTEIQAVGRDITERKRVEEELERRRAELQTIYDHAPFMLCLLDQKRRVVFANRLFIAHTGMTAEGCLHQVACGVMHCIGASDDPRGCGYGPKCRSCALRRAITDTLETGRSHRNVEHTTALMQEGVRREVIWLAATDRVSEEGEPRVLLAIQDITEYRQAEAELVASEARLRALYEHSPVGILFTAPDGRVFNANPAACGMLGRTEEEIRRLGRSGLLDQADPNLETDLAERLRTGKVRTTPTYNRADGSRFRADTISVIFDTAEGPRTCTIIQDVSEREAAAERIRDFSHRLLGIREEEKQRLSAALHHDVGSMAVGVGARLQAAEEDLHSGKLREAVAALRECRHLFDDSVQRLKSLAMELRPPDLDILGLPVALRQHFAQVTRRTPLQILFTDATHGAVIESEIETALFRVAQECINNVSKHAQASRVRVRLAAAKRSIRLSIADDGVGIDPSSAAGQTSGGMGLLAVREMMGAQGGELTIHSARGKGTRILAVFPMKGDPP
jgi:PAS domain S-box-containing protein